MPPLRPPTPRGTEVYVSVFTPLFTPLHAPLEAKPLTNKKKSPPHRPQVHERTPTEFIRIVPMAWHAAGSAAFGAMRVSVKMEGGHILDKWGDYYSASSVAAYSTAAAVVGRGRTWQPAAGDSAPYIQMEVPEGQFTAVVTQGDGNTNTWATRYKIQQSSSKLGFNPRYIKITPANGKYYGGHMSIRAGLELDDGRILGKTDKNLYSVKTVTGGNGCYANRALWATYCDAWLDSPYGWLANKNNAGSYMVIEVPEGRTAVKIGTQGRGNYNQWVTAYSVHVSLDGTHWVDLEDQADRPDGLFTGNSDRHTKEWHSLSFGTFTDVPCSAAKGNTCDGDEYVANVDALNKVEQAFVGNQSSTSRCPFCPAGTYGAQLCDTVMMVASGKSTGFVGSQDARTKCTLARPDSPDAQSLVAAAAATSGSALVWLGGRFDATKNTWKWEDGTSIQIPFKPEILERDCVASAKKQYFAAYPTFDSRIVASSWGHIGAGCTFYPSNKRAYFNRNPAGRLHTSFLPVVSADISYAGFAHWEDGTRPTDEASAAKPWLCMRSSTGAWLPCGRDSCPDAALPSKKCSNPEKEGACRYYTGIGSYTVTAAGFSNPNNIVVDGIYTKQPGLHATKAFWHTDSNGGMYLRWASTWNQWIFDDDLVDTTSVAYVTGTVASTMPTTGTFTTWKYGSTSGNNGANVPSMKIGTPPASQTTCSKFCTAKGLTCVGMYNVTTGSSTCAGDTSFSCTGIFSGGSEWICECEPPEVNYDAACADDTQCANGPTTAECTGACPLGYYCPRGSPTATSFKCLAGHAGTVGATTTDGIGDTAKTCGGKCDPGHYCIAGSASKTGAKCPGGKVCVKIGNKYVIVRVSFHPPSHTAVTYTSFLLLYILSEFDLKYGSFGGLTSAMCSGPCPAGHHCPEGSEFPLPCTSEVEYCPEGSASPLTPSAGHYTVSNDDVVGISFVVAAGKIYNAHAMVGLGADMGKTYPTKGDYAIYLYSDRRVRVYLRNKMKYHAPSNDLFLVNDRFEIKYEDEGVSFYRCRAGTCLQFYTTGVDTTGTGNLLQLPRPIATADDVDTSSTHSRPAILYANVAMYTSDSVLTHVKWITHSGSQGQWCLDAAVGEHGEKVQGKSLSKGTWDDRPSGCIVHTGDWKAYFNLAKVGAPNSKFTQVTWFVDFGSVLGQSPHV